jgi:hypothetical protein
MSPRRCAFAATAAITPFSSPLHFHDAADTSDSSATRSTERGSAKKQQREAGEQRLRALMRAARPRAAARRRRAPPRERAVIFVAAAARQVQQVNISSFSTNIYAAPLNHATAPDRKRAASGAQRPLSSPRLPSPPRRCARMRAGVRSGSARRQAVASARRGAMAKERDARVADADVALRAGGAAGACFHARHITVITFLFAATLPPSLPLTCHVSIARSSR